MQAASVPSDRETNGAGSSFGESETAVVDLRQILNFFWRNALLIGAVVVVLTGAGVAYQLSLTPMYAASAEIVIEPRQKNLVEEIGSVLSALPPDAAVIDTEVRVLRSRDVAERVIDRYDLMNDPEFNEAAAEDAPEPSTAVNAIAAREEVLIAFWERLAILREDLSFAIRIQFQSEDPSKAALLANAVSEAYLDAQRAVKLDATDEANAWLEERIADLREDVRAAETAVEEFRAENGLFDADGATLTDQKLAGLNATLAEAQAEQAEKRGRLRRLKQLWKSGGDVASIPEALSSPVISGLRTQQAEVIRRRAELSSRYGPRHPDIIEVERELSDLEDQIAAEMERISANLETEVDLAGEKVRSLEATMARLESSSALDQKSLVRLRELEREAEASKTLFESFLTRYKATQEQSSLQYADSRILSRAAPPLNPVFPQKTRFVVLTFVGSLVIGAGFAALFEMLHMGFSTDEEFERALGLRHLGYVPKLKLPRRLRGKRQILPAPTYIAAQPQSPFAEAFGRMRLLIGVGADDAPRRLLFASAAPDEGKTTVAASFARSVALSGAPTLLIDADLRRPSVHKCFRNRPKGGVMEYLDGELSIGEVIGRDDMTPLHYLPVLRRPEDPRELLTSKAYQDLIDRLSRKYERIIFDTSPVLPVSDGVALASTVADATILVVRWRKTSTKLAQAAIKELRSAKAPIIGGVLSQVEMLKLRKYGYGAYYGEYKSRLPATPRSAEKSALAANGGAAPSTRRGANAAAGSVVKGAPGPRPAQTKSGSSKHAAKTSLQKKAGADRRPAS
ncbi:MAG: Wzz/FepE/Etk N-terminal domain-containing protein [Pseudomonadota bacterium]